MFIKSFFAEPAAVVRPRLIVSAAGRVLAALFIAAAGLMVSAQSAFAQLQQGASLRYHATLVNSPSPSIEDARGVSYTDPMIVLKHIQANNKPEIADFEVDDPANPGQRIKAPAERNKYKILRLYTPKSSFISAIRMRAIDSSGNLDRNGQFGAIGGNTRQLQKDGRTYIQVTSTGNTSVINDSQYNLVLDLLKNHGFVHGDEIEVRVAKPAAGNDPEVEETLFTMVMHLLDFGTDDDIYTVNAKAGERSSRDYPLAELPANSQGVGTLEYKLIGGSDDSTEPPFSTDPAYDFDNDVWGSGTQHITGSRRNFLRVSGSNGKMTSRATSGNNDENVYYYVKDVNDVVIRRPYNFYLIAGLKDDDVDDSIPTFEQRMWCGEENCGQGNGIEGRIRVYAREIFGPDASRLELARPASADRATHFALRARKRIGPSNTADVTINLVGAVMAGEMEPRHFRALSSAEEALPGITVTKKSGGGVGDSSVVYTVETNSQGTIDVGDILRVDMPALTGADLSDGSNITINATVHSTRASGARFNFPTGAEGVSKCLSYRIGESRECVFATSHDAVTSTIVASVGAPGDYASINAGDTTSLISHGEDPRDAILPIFIQAGEYGRNQSGDVNAIAMGAARVVLDVDATYDGVAHKAMQANGTIFEVGPPTTVQTTIGSGLILTVSPTPTHGHVVVSNAVNSQGRRQISPVAAGTTRQRIYLSDDGDKVSELYEIFYIPSEITPLSGGATYTLSGEVDLGSDEYQDEASTGSRTVTLRLHAVEAKAKAYAIPPPSSRDQAFIRIRCEDESGCDVSLNCSNQTGNSWFGSLESRISAHGTTVVTADIIAQTLASDGFVPSRHWGGPTNGRLSCQILARQNQSITTQVLVRSGDILTNNTHVNQSVPN